MVDMLKIWGKTYDGEKITRTKVIEFESAHIIFYDMVKTVCEKLDIATPVCLNKHYEDFMQFRTCFFKSGDFIDSVDFTKFQIQLIIDK